MGNHIEELFASELVVINVGPRIFGDAVREQGVEAVQVDWQPAAPVDEEMQDILDLLGGV